MTKKLARRAVQVFNLPPTALPLDEKTERALSEKDDLLASQLVTLGFPKFSHFKKT